MAKPTDVSGFGPRTPLSNAAPALIAQRLADVRHLAQGSAQALSVDGVHDVRVAARRLRAALEMWRDPRQHILRRRTSRLIDSLGLVRDLNIQLQWLRQAAFNPGEEHPLALASLTGDLERELEPRLRQLAKALAGWRREARPPAKEMPIAGRLAGRRMRKALEVTSAQFRTRLRRALHHASPKRAHALRKATRRLRYQLELLAPGFEEGGLDATWRRALDFRESDSVRGIIRQLAELQSILGDLHDLDVRRVMASCALRDARRHSRPELQALCHQLQLERSENARSVRRHLRRWRA